MSISTTPQSTGSRESIGQPGRYTSSTKDAGGSMSTFRKAPNQLPQPTAAAMIVLEGSLSAQSIRARPGKPSEERAPSKQE
jgi:hypothetical protein